MTNEEELKLNKIIGYNNYLLQEVERYKVALHNCSEQKKKFEAELRKHPTYLIKLLFLKLFKKK